MKSIFEKVTNKFSRKICIGLVLIPFICIIIIIVFRWLFSTTNDGILDKIQSSKGYTADVEYVIKNQKGQYIDEAKMEYVKDSCSKIQFKGNITKVYNSDGTVEINDNGYCYTSNSKNDVIYSLANINNTLKGNNYLQTEIQQIREEEEEWAEKEYLVVDFSTISDNRHVNRASMFIDKKEKVPCFIIVYDSDNLEKAKIIFKNFKYI